MPLFRLDASIFPATSTTRALGDIVESEWKQHSGASVVRRDLAAEPVSATAWQGALAATQTAEAERTAADNDALGFANGLAQELIDADALLFTVPLYNYGVSQHFKTWFDVAYTDPRTGPAGTALNGKPAVLITALGGNYSPGAPKEGWDHSTGWIRRVFEDVWGLDLHVIQRPFTFVGVNPALDEFKDEAEEFRRIAVEESEQAGRQIAKAYADRS